MEAYKIGKLRNVKLPSNWSEVPFHKGLKIFEGELNEIEILALLSDREPEEIRKSTDIETIFYLINAFTYLGKLPDELNFPYSAKTKDDILLFPNVDLDNKFDLGECSVGQVEDMQSIIVKECTTYAKDDKDEDGNSTGKPTDEESKQMFSESMKAIPAIVSIYIQKIIDGEYDGKKALARVSEVEQMSFKDVYVIGSFFLQRLVGLRGGQVKELHQRNTVLKRLKRGLTGLTRRLGFTLSLI